MEEVFSEVESAHQVLSNQRGSGRLRLKGGTWKAARAELVERGWRSARFRSTAWESRTPPSAIRTETAGSCNSYHI